MIIVGAAARLTRLLSRDVITQPLRDAVLFNREQRRARKEGRPAPVPRWPDAARFRAWAHTLITCDWCAGFWVSAMTVAAYLASHGHPLFLVPAAVFAVSHAVGWMAEHESPA